MDEMMWRMTGGGFGSGVDLAAVLAFVAFGVVAFLAPVIGYQRRPGGVIASLFLLVAYVGVSVVQMLFQWSQVVDGFGGLGRRPESGVHLLFLVAVFKMMLFGAAMLTFALGVLSLRLRHSRSDDFPLPYRADR